MWLLETLSVAEWLLCLVILLAFTNIYFSWAPNKWKSQGIAGPRSYPFVGTNGDVFVKGAREMYKERLQKYGKVYGEMEYLKPVLVVGDGEMLRQIMVKQFAAFPDRRVLETGDELTMAVLPVQKGHSWRRVRHTLAPFFSTANLKVILTKISDCCELLVHNVDDLCKNKQDMECREYQSHKDLNMGWRGTRKVLNSVSGAYTMDVIARTAFGVEVNSQKDTESEFVRHGSLAVNSSPTRPLFLLLVLFPWALPMLKWIRVSIFDMRALNFFTDFVERALRERKGDNGNGENDFLQLMLNSHTDVLDTVTPTAPYGLPYLHEHPDQPVSKGLSRTEIVAHGFLFFIAGYETTASSLSMLLHSLAINPECQQKLYDHIIDQVGDQGELSHESLGRLTYLEMCIEETLRLYPPVFRMERVAAADVTVSGIHISKGDVILIPVIGLHYDPQIYPQPEKFVPERFTSEAKAARHPFHYLPFGHGPRGCIGMRLSIMEIKMAAVHLLRKYRFLACDKTECVPKFQSVGQLRAVNGLWVKVERRD